METNNNKCEEITQARDPSTAPVCQNIPTSSTVHKIHSQPEHNTLTMMHLIKSAQTTPIPLPSPLKLHIDGGANRSITNDLTLLLWQKNIKPYYMSSASQSDSICCTAVGYLLWHSRVLFRQKREGNCGRHTPFRTWQNGWGSSCSL